MKIGSACHFLFYMFIGKIRQLRRYEHINSYIYLVIIFWKGGSNMSDMTKPVNLISSSNENTVVSDYKPEVRNRSEYESEAKLEEGFIKLLQELGYTYLKIDNENDLLNNLRKQIERLKERDRISSNTGNT